MACKSRHKVESTLTLTLSRKAGRGDQNVTAILESLKPPHDSRRTQRIYPQDGRLTIDPNRRGKPCIRGTRITVQDVLEYLAGGMTVQQILNDFPDLTLDDIEACLTITS